MHSAIVNGSINVDPALDGSRMIEFAKLKQLYVDFILDGFDTINVASPDI